MARSTPRLLASLNNNLFSKLIEDYYYHAGNLASVRDVQGRPTRSLLKDNTITLSSS
jgi:hypothetical protein